MTDNHENRALQTSTDIANERLRNPHESLHPKTSKLLKMRSVLPSDFLESSKRSPESLAHLTLSLSLVLPEFGDNRAAAQRFYNDVKRVMAYTEAIPNVPVIDIMFRAEEILKKQKDVKTKPQAIKIALGVQTVPVRIDLIEQLRDTLDELRRENEELRLRLIDVEMTVTHVFKGMIQVVDQNEDHRIRLMDLSDAVLLRTDTARGSLVNPVAPVTTQPVPPVPTLAVTPVLTQPGPSVPIRPIMRSGKIEKDL